MKKQESYTFTIDFKDPDSVFEMCEALGIKSKTRESFFEFSEYGSVELTVGPGLEITKAAFKKRGKR